MSTGDIPLPVQVAPYGSACLERDLSAVLSGFQAGTHKWSLALVAAEERIAAAIDGATDIGAVRSIAHTYGQVIELLTQHEDPTP